MKERLYEDIICQLYDVYDVVVGEVRVVVKFNGFFFC